MFLIIGRFIKGIILGWILSLIFYLVKRALARAFGNVQQAQQSSRTHADPYQQSSSAGHDVVETIWAGMSINQLRTAFGTPQSKQNIQGGEVWVYANLNGQGTETAITIENGMVSNWSNQQISLSGQDSLR
jgi:hypothetical protein